MYFMSAAVENYTRMQSRIVQFLFYFVYFFFLGGGGGVKLGGDDLINT